MFDRLTLLWERRVLHVLAGYLGVGWGVVLSVEWLAERSAAAGED